MPKKSTRVYIDGFNLYHGIIRDNRLHWLNLEEFCRRLNMGVAPLEMNTAKYTTTELMAACHRCGCAMATVSGGTGNVTHDGKPVGNSEIGSVLV